MAVKIVYKDTKKINMGKIDNKYFKTKCSTCSSIFVYTSKDINIVLKSKVSEGVFNIQGRAIRCPVCKEICCVEGNMFTNEITKIEYESYGG